MRVLVAYASRSGSTAEVAAEIARGLRAAGHSVDLHAAGVAADATGYDAVVLGSAIYNTRWLAEAGEFARRNLRALASRPVWLFSVGSFGSDQGWPWGALARSEPRGIAALIAAIYPRDYHVFAGAVAAERLSLVGRIVYTLLKGRCGDYRDRRAIAAWAEGIARRLANDAASGGRPVAD